ncbi:M20/M25/M40 family metallo-hydrolase [Tunicatimonas pelagia]|uniref:M20/M25/M40 family metallo-hydrolase n=1 Tax=Tunicatimonas pelagia TaxID=931531 RepID=UPI00266571CA|nr:aminopeptidase [Tunicatimonas pelagia]WKN42521.1 aminopeptidase [Tunicatimonas pelagia]
MTSPFDSDWKLLEQLCQVQAPSGNEGALKQYILAYVQQQQESWQRQPKIIQGDGFQDCLILVFGQPRTAVFAHMDSVGFTVRYQDQLVPIGSPKAESGTKLVGKDQLGPILCELNMDQADENSPKQAKYDFGRGIERGTELVYECHFQQSDDYVHSCYLDNRLGVLNALKLAETLEDGILVFSCWEEHGGGSVPYLAKFIFEEYGVSQCLISDVTWVTDGIPHGEGTVISLRDRNIPRRAFVNQIVALAQESGVSFQLEVEGSGSSDGRELQLSPYPFNWCFIGAPVTDAHTPQEKVYWPDATHMFALYQYLMKNL